MTGLGVYMVLGFFGGFGGFGGLGFWGLGFTWFWVFFGGVWGV